jgi:hypothetical protein
VLTIIVALEGEMFDEESQEFIPRETTTLELEHSLVSLSKWESKHEKPFLGKEEKTTEETIDYIRCMTVTPNVSENVFSQLSEENILEINAYIEAKMTATWFSDAPGAPQSRDVITAELIYYWMVVFQIPFECEHWHLNRLFTLIRVCNIKQSKPKKMSRSELAARNRELNAQRRAQLGSSG